MCGCMLMHTMMNHQEHQPATQPVSASGANPIQVTNGQRCTQCGFPVQKVFSFCPSCGKSLHSAVCPACGQKIDPGWSECAFCGAPLGEPQQQAAHH